MAKIFELFFKSVLVKKYTLIKLDAIPFPVAIDLSKLLIRKLLIQISDDTSPTLPKKKNILH